LSFIKDVTMGRFAAAVSMLVQKYWDRIDKTITSRLVELGEPLEDPFSFTALTGISPVTGMLGCGHWGCVYPLAVTDRWVLKVTTDPAEASIISVTRNRPELHTHPGIVRYEGLWALPETAVLDGWTENVERAIYVVLREEATPLMTPGELDEFELDSILLALDSAVQASKRVGLAEMRLSLASSAHSPNTLELMKFRNQVIADWAEEIGVLEKFRPTHNVGSFMRAFFVATGSVLADVHGGNVGFRNYDLRDLFGRRTPQPTDSLVILDPGHSFVCAEILAPYIENPPIDGVV
jgi:hypothetical protein